MLDKASAVTPRNLLNGALAAVVAAALGPWTAALPPACGGEAAAASTMTMTCRTMPAAGLGPEEGVMRRDPSDVIKANGLYYVWYTKGKVAHGYDATVWYATSPDGLTWTEKGEALARGPQGGWDERSVFTPNILVGQGKYWLFFSGVSGKYVQGQPDTAIGIAVSDTPDGPWRKMPGGPVLKATGDPKDFDSMLVDDACLIVRGGKYWLYFKGRQLGNTPANTKLGVAIADKPEGPYVRHPGNPVVEGGHEVLVWPYGRGVAAMINIGPPVIRSTIQYAEDGLHFSKLADVVRTPSAPGAFRPEAFTDSGKGGMIRWGIHIGTKKGFLPFLQRFECEMGSTPNTALQP
jgi:predicted GH43/DUF377 family glycosyl hydrolase